jgi:cell division transport system permease protein
MSDRRLGIAEDARRYDLPFHKDEGVDFLALLIALMTFLAVMALTTSFVLGGMAERWSSGLTNRLTIEIPVEDPKAELRNAVSIRALEDKAAIALKNNPQVATVHIMEKEDIQNLVEPWLGKDAMIETLPLPGLISIELKTSTPEVLEGIKKDMLAVATDINVDTHEAWLGDLLRLTGTLQFATFVVTLAIGLTTIAAVSGGVRSRIAIHKADVELLHLMGASDEYITKQFQRHTLILGLKGGGAGLLAGVAIMVVVKAFSGNAGIIMPDMALKPIHIIALIVIPVIAALIAGFTARLTVLRALSQMP